MELSFWVALQKHQHAFEALPEREYPLPAEGRNYRGDFVFVAERVVVEIDGHQHHSHKAAMVKDRQRERRLYRAGWRIIRFMAAEVIADANACVAELIEMLGLEYPEHVLTDKELGIETSETVQLPPAPVLGGNYIPVATIQGVSTRTIKRRALGAA